MVLSTFLPKSEYMLSQQMKSIDCSKFEDGDLQLLLSSNSVANYNVQHKNISQTYSPIDSFLLSRGCSINSQLATTDRKDSFLLSRGCSIDTLLNPTQRSPVPPPSLNRIYYYFEGYLNLWHVSIIDSRSVI